MNRRNFLAVSGIGLGFLGVPALGRGTALGKINSDPMVIGPASPTQSTKWEWKKVETTDIEIHEYDEYEHLVYHKDFGDNKRWWRWDDDGNCTYLRHNMDGGYEEWLEYNDDGNMTHRKNSYGFEEWKDYDIVGRLVHRKDTNGMEFWYELNEAGNTIKTTRKRSTVKKIVRSQG